MSDRDDSCGCRGCCNFPNGMLGILALIFAIVSFVCGFFANNTCFYVTVDLTQGGGGDVFPALNDVGLGLWSRQEFPNQNGWSCTYWSSTEVDELLDAKWKAATYLGYIGQIFGFINLIICMCLSCTSVSKMFLKLVSIMYLLAGTCCALTLIAFSSDICNGGCTFSMGAALVIPATVFYLFNACVVAKIPMYQGTEQLHTPGAATAGETSPPPGSVSVTTTDLPDGTTKVTRTTVNADGSKTVEETIENPTTTEPTDSAKAY